MTILVLLVALFSFLLIGAPVAVSLGLASILTMLLFGDQSLVALSQKFFHTTQVYPLLAVPFFILAGVFMTTGGVARRRDCCGRARLCLLASRGLAVICAAGARS